MSEQRNEPIPIANPKVSSLINSITIKLNDLLLQEKYDILVINNKKLTEENNFLKEIIQNNQSEFNSNLQKLSDKYNTLKEITDKIKLEYITEKNEEKSNFS